MSFIKKIGDFFAGAGGNVIETLAETADRFITNPQEKKEFLLEIKRQEEQQRQNQRIFIREMEELVQKRESEIEQTIRAELNAKKSIIVAELEQGDKYTKRARPTVVYVGLIFILLEVFGLRHLILSNMDLGGKFDQILASSDAVFNTFLVAWGGVVGIYAVGRSAEKRGTRNSWTQAITGSAAPGKVNDSVIVNSVKDKLKDIKW